MTTTHSTGDGLHTLGRWPADRARLSPARVAVGDRGVEVTYGELADRVEQLAARLRAAGIGRGDRVASLVGNSTGHVVLLFACARVGAALAPLSWRLSAGELARQVELLDPVLLVEEDETHAAVQALQVKQQPGVQALSIANQAPSTITSLFR